MESPLKGALWMLSIIIAIISGSITIYQWLKEPYKLEAYVFATQAPLPQRIIDELNSFQDISVEDIKKEYKEVPEVMKVPDNTIKQALPIFSRIIRNYVSFITDPPGHREEHLLIIMIRNAGDQAITGVELKSKCFFNFTAQIERDTGKREVQKFSGKLIIGNLAPRSEMIIYNYSSAAFPIYKSSIALTHDKGVGKITYLTRSPGTISEENGIFLPYYQIVPILAVIFTSLILVFLAGGYLEKRDQQKEKEAQTEPESK